MDLDDTYVAQSRKSSQTMADAVADALRNAILAGALPAGQPLRQETLAARFGVSRVPIREALLKLETDGLVASVPRRGTVVASLDIDDFQEILEMRVALEQLAVEKALPGVTAGHLDEAGRVLQRAEEAFALASRGGANAELEFETRWGELNWQFHRALYQAAGRPRLLDTIENLHLQFARHLRARLQVVAPALLPTADRSDRRDLGEWRTVLDEHRAILQAFERGDLPGARSVLKRHIGHHGRELVKRLRAAAGPAS
ncbi:MAG: GntR family transcriptional regulator [Burkholderiaceae bacterium]